MSEETSRNIVETWMAIKDGKLEKMAERRKENDKKDEDDYQVIKKFLNHKGITEIHTNKYWYDFVYNELVIHFVNQTGRLVGTIHRILNDDNEKCCIKDAYEIESYDTNLYAEFKKEFRYKSFIIDGSVLTGLYYIFDLIE